MQMICGYYHDSCKPLRSQFLSSQFPPRERDLGLSLPLKQLITEAIELTLLKILRSEEYLFEDSRGLVGSDGPKVREPKSRGNQPSVLKLLTKIEGALFRGRDRDNPKVRYP